MSIIETDGSSDPDKSSQLLHGSLDSVMPFKLDGLQQWLPEWSSLLTDVAALLAMSLATL